MPDYQVIRKKHSLRDLFFTPELAAEITLMPIHKLGVDAAILFSDITVIALALGLKLDFAEGPQITPLLQNSRDVDDLPMLDVKEVLHPIGETVALTSRMDCPVIGFCGGPFTVASYLIEKHMGNDLPITKKWLYQDPDSFHRLLDKITTVSSTYLQMQVEKGASVIQIFDSWAHVLTEQQFKEVCLPYWEKLLRSVTVPGIVFARGNSFRVKQIGRCRPSAISVDWMIPIDRLRKKTPLPLQGNLDPDLLFAPLKTVEKTVLQMLESMRKDPGFIVNLGHGVKPNTPIEAVHCLVDTVKGFS